MKKILYILAVATLTLCACSKGADIVGGHDHYYYSPGGSYMMHIADDLIAGALEELEMARDMGKTDITWASHFSGMTLIKADENVWQLSFEGPFEFDNQTYHTAFTMTATQLNEKKHADWDISFSGSRTERDGYRCTFESLGAITYQALNTNTGWDRLFGHLSMIVYNKDGKKDGCLLHFDGAPSEAQFVRGL